ncbi:unnamed protein product [Prorocentrum cordatum]|uniref:Uncharacterized protein n=1 Tax=Prorocentrum cordatum TaxID=2364126 RepID=A0ABN9YB78_9DINO|nr:unnamed protein product [Polarella glacialis]
MLGSNISSGVGGNDGDEIDGLSGPGAVDSGDQEGAVVCSTACTATLPTQACTSIVGECLQANPAALLNGGTVGTEDGEREFGRQRSLGGDAHVDAEETEMLEVGDSGGEPSSFGASAHERELASPVIFAFAPDSTLVLGGGNRRRSRVLQRLMAASDAVPLVVGGPAERSAVLDRFSHAQLCYEQARLVCSVVPMALHRCSRDRLQRSILEGSPRGAPALPLAYLEGPASASGDHSRRALPEPRRSSPSSDELFRGSGFGGLSSA